MKTKIQWTEYTWNFISGCTQISPACENCYAKAMTKRLQGIAKAKTSKLLCKECGFDWCNEFDTEDCNLEKGKVLCVGDCGSLDLHEAFDLPMYWFGWDKVLFHKQKLEQILDKKKHKSGSKVFVCSMSDLFHEDIDFGDIVEAFYYMSQRQDLTFQILTKRPERMLEFFNDYLPSYINGEFADYFYEDMQNHIWLGVTAENQEMADKRIPLLLQCKHLTACKSFVSIEPMLKSVNLVKYLYTKDHPPFGDDISGLDWVIVGGESGNRARKTNAEWVINLYQQCRDYGIPFFFKQKGNCFIHSHLEYRDIIERIENTKEFP